MTCRFTCITFTTVSNNKKKLHAKERIQERTNKREITGNYFSFLNRIGLAKKRNKNKMRKLLRL